MAYNRPSTIQRVSDQVLGHHVETTAGILLAANFTIAASTDLFNVFGRIQINQLFIEFTAAADINATQLVFYYDGSEPALTLVDLCGAGDSIASLDEHGRCMYTGGTIANTPIVSDSEGLTDLEMAAERTIVGGYATGGATGIFTGTIGITASVATQAASVAASGHIFYTPLSPDAAVEAAI